MYFFALSFQCVCAMQGSFAAGTFAAYVPALHEAELCDVPGVEDD